MKATKIIPGKTILSEIGKVSFSRGEEVTCDVESFSNSESFNRSKSIKDVWSVMTQTQKNIFLGVLKAMIANTLEVDSIEIDGEFIDE